MKTKYLMKWLLVACVLWGCAPVAQAFYNPSSGRWLSRDPIEELGHNNLLLEIKPRRSRTDDSNLFGFTQNNPVNLVDVDGRDNWWDTSIEVCNRKIENPADDAVLGCANVRGHDFYRWPDGKGAWGSIGYQDPNGKKGSLPKPDHPEDARTCRSCDKIGGELKFGSGKGKSARSASDAEVQDCLRNRPIKDDYNGLLNNSNDWAKEAGKACGLKCVPGSQAQIAKKSS